MFRDLATKATHGKASMIESREVSSFEKGRSVFLCFQRKTLILWRYFYPEMTSFLSNNFDRLIGIIFSLSPEIVFLDRIV